MAGCLSCLFWWALPPSLPFATAKLRMKTFDLVYFCYLSTWSNPFVALFAGKVTTHMGMVVRYQDKIYLLEAIRNKDAIVDVLAGDGKPHTGVRLINFERLITEQRESYYIYVQPVEMTADAREQATERLWPFIRKFNHHPFEPFPDSFVTAALNAPFGHHREDLAGLFCSELCALALRDCGLLTVDNVSAVWHTTFLSCLLLLERGARLSQEGFYVRRSPQPLAAPPPMFSAPPARSVPRLRNTAADAAATTTTEIDITDGDAIIRAIQGSSSKPVVVPSLPP